MESRFEVKRVTGRIGARVQAGHVFRDVEVKDHALGETYSLVAMCDLGERACVGVALPKALDAQTRHELRTFLWQQWAPAEALC